MLKSAEAKGGDVPVRPDAADTSVPRGGIGTRLTHPLRVLPQQCSALCDNRADTPHNSIKCMVAEPDAQSASNKEQKQTGSVWEYVDAAKWKYRVERTYYISSRAQLKSLHRVSKKYFIPPIWITMEAIFARRCRQLALCAPCLVWDTTSVFT